MTAGCTGYANYNPCRFCAKKKKFASARVREKKTLKKAVGNFAAFLEFIISHPENSNWRFIIILFRVVIIICVHADGKL